MIEVNSDKKFLNKSKALHNNPLVVILHYFFMKNILT